jgi:hypothetical protein
MTRDVAILIVNYNMPERTDALVEHINQAVKWPYQLFVIDNGSDITEPSQFTNVFIPKNVQTTGGWLRGLEAADASPYTFLAYWFLITSAEFPRGDADPLAPLANLLVEIPDAVGVHPALTPDSTTSWTHLKTRGGNEPRRTWMIDNIASLYRADWFDEIGRFDPQLVYAWGIDLETCYMARKQKRSLWVHEGSLIKKETNVGYNMDRMNMAAGKREQLAGENMRKILNARYGFKWWQIMINAYVEREWR